MSENPTQPSPPEKKIYVRPGPKPRQDWQENFLEAFALHGIKTRACKQADVTRKTVDAERRRSETFAVLYDHAYEEAADNLETFAHKWATTGLEERNEELSYDDKGKVIARKVRVTANVSPTLLIFMLKAMRPKKYRDNVRIEQTGAGGGPIRVKIDGERVDREVDRLLGKLAGRG